MTIETDPSLYSSNYERMEGDRYWTEPWLTRALLDCIGMIPSNIWEPAAGRGDISRVLEDFGHEVVATDIDMHECVTQGYVLDFLATTELPKINNMEVNGIITNPPYNIPQGVAAKFVRHGLQLMRDKPELRFMAMLLRSEFCNARTRKDMFGECDLYRGEVVVTKRPRWDWWFRDKSLASPRHNFSWFVWGIPGPYTPELPIQLFYYGE